MAEQKPVPCRHFALCDRQETGEPCLRGEQVVAIWVLRSVRREIANRQQFAVFIEEEGEFHLQRYVAASLRC